MPKIDLQLSCNCPARGLLSAYQKCDNKSMEKMIEWLRSIGWDEPALEYVRAHYEDEDLREYLLYLRAVYDDRHEYV